MKLYEIYGKVTVHCHLFTTNWGVSLSCTKSYLNIIYVGCNDSIIVCISPLTSIMINQRESFKSVGIIAEYVGEAQEDSNTIKLMDTYIHSSLAYWWIYIYAAFSQMQG